MAIDIDSFLNKLESKEEAKKLAPKTPKEEIKKIDLNFEKTVIDNFQDISSDIKEKDLIQLKEIYEDLKKFDETMPSKFLSIQNIGSSTLETLNSEYSSKLLEALENNAKYYSNQIKENNTKIEEDLISKEYKISLRLLKENKKLLQSFPEEFANEKYELSLFVKKYELKLHQEIRNFKLNDSSNVKKEIFRLITEIKEVIKTNSIDEIEHKIRELEMALMKIPPLFRFIFTDENILIQKSMITAEQKIIELKNKEFTQKEKELKLIQDKFQNSLIKKDLNSALLLYNEILLVFEDLPNTNFKVKNSYLSILSKLHGQLNNLYVKSNVELLLKSYSNSKVIEEARNYIDHIELTRKISPENIRLIYNKLKELPHSSHIEQESMMRKYEILLEKISPENREIEDNKKIVNKQKNNEVISKAREYLNFVKETQNVSENMIKKTLQELKNLQDIEKDENLIKNYETILSKIAKKKPKILSQNHKVKIDKNVASEIEELYSEMKQSPNKKEKIIIYKKILFYLDLVNLPESKKNRIKNRIKKTYERD